MFGQAAKLSGRDPKPSDTIIASGVTVSGSLTSDGDITVDGTLDGTISTQGSVRIGPNGYVTADIECGTLTVDGQLRGGVAASEAVYINQTGRVIGDIACRQLDVELGGIVNGQVQTEDPEATPTAADEE